MEPLSGIVFQPLGKMISACQAENWKLKKMFEKAEVFLAN